MAEATLDDYNAQEPHLRDSIKVLFRRRYYIAIPVLLAVGLIAAYSLSMHPVYHASATIQLESEKGTSLSFNQASFPDYGWMDEKWFNTQVRILNSRPLAEGVMNRLGLRLQTKPEERVYQILIRAWIPESIIALTKSSSFKVKPVAVGAGAKNGEYRGAFRDGKNYTVYDPQGKEIGQGEVGQPFVTPEFSFVLHGPGATGESFEFQILSAGLVTRQVMESLMVAQVKNSNLINVGAKWWDAEWARSIANATVDEYKDTLISKRTRETSQVLTFIETQLTETEKDLQAAEESLRKFKEKGGLVYLDAQARKALEQITDYEKELRTVETYRKQSEILLADLKKQAAFSDQKALLSLGMGIGNEYLKELSKKHSDLAAQRSSLATLMKDDHPKMQALDREIDSVKKNMVQEVAGMTSSLRVKEAGYQSSLKKLEESTHKLPAVEKELFALERVAKVGQGINLFLLQKRAELSINKASVLANVQVIDPAIRSGHYAEPDLLKRILWAFLIGTGLGMSLAFFKEYFDTTMKSPEEVQRMTTFPYLGTIYHSITSSDSPAGELKMLESPYSHVAEAFRTIKTNLLHYSTAEEYKKFILITSSGPAEGKTFVTANLAVALAQSGKKVLVAEADLRNPTLHKVFGLKRSPGLTNALRNGMNDLSYIPVQRTPLENLKFIAAGDKTYNPSELLCSEKMDRFMSMVKDQFDYILFDSPPAYLTSDPLVMAQRMDGVVFVARSGEVRKDVFKEVMVNFSKIESKMMGVIFNDMHREEGKYYYYKYSYYYEEGENGRERKKRRIRSSRMRKLYPGNYGGEKNTGKYLRPH
jgi:capsular exopolysaccharide synthesis family protein